MEGSILMSHLKETSKRTERPKLLIFCSHYPPGPKTGGVARVSKLVKYLPEYGWSSVIVTSRFAEEDSYSSELYAEISDKGLVFRLPSFYPGGLIKIIANTITLLTSLPMTLYKQILGGINNSDESNFNKKREVITRSDQYFLPDIGVFWGIVAGVAGIKYAKKYQPRIILATAPFHSSLISAFLTARFSGLPFVIDLRDPWTTNPFASAKKFKILESLEDALERFIFKRASKIICVHSNFIDPIILKHGLSIDKFAVIPNGYDEDDFKDLEAVKFPKLTIVHTGSFYPGRTPDIFMQALEIISKKNPNLLSGWDVKFIGSPADYKSEESESILKCGIHNMGHLGRNETIKNMAGADILLLLPGVGATSLTGKIFEYMAVKKPIFCISDKGAASEIIEEFDIGFSADLNSVADVAEKLNDLMSAISDKRLHPAKDSHNLARYTRLEIAKSFDKTLRDILMSSVRNED